MFKKIFFISLISVFLLPLFVLAKEDVDLRFFWAKGCPFCEEQKVFLEKLAEKYPDLKIHQYNLHEADNMDILKKLMKERPGSERYFGTVPLTFVGEDFFVGFSKDIGNKIENSIEKYYQENEKEIRQKEIFYLPILGDLDPQKRSLGALAAIIGAIDGFNVCSLGALVIVLLLALALKSRKLILLFGGLFIFVTAIIYGFLIFLWHQLFSILLPYMSLMKFITGIAALLGGFYFLKQFFKFKKQGPSCQIGGNKIINAATKKLENSFKSPRSNTAAGGKEKRNVWFLLGGVILFAALVTIIEFPCSAVFPVVFTGILAQAKLSLIASLFYIFVYLFFYMLDEIFVFLIAVFTRKIWIASGMFMTAVSLVGAIVLFFLSYYYLFVL